MNRAWMALAGFWIAVVVSAETRASGRDTDAARPPTFERPSNEDCRAARRGIAADQRRDPNRALVIEGVSTFFGYCHREDRARGLAMTERGVRAGFKDAAAAVGEMYETIGKTDVAAQWYESAAMDVLLRESLSTPPISVIYRPPALETALNQMRAALDAPDLPWLTAALERLDSRPSIFRNAERYFLNEAAEALWRARRPESLYWLARISLDGGQSEESAAIRRLQQASICGVARAIREHAVRFLDDRAPFGDPRRISEAVARLNQVTQSEGELLARVERRLGHAAYASPDAVRQGIERAAAECRLILPPPP